MSGINLYGDPDEDIREAEQRDEEGDRREALLGEPDRDEPGEGDGEPEATTGEDPRGNEKRPAG